MTQGTIIPSAVDQDSIEYGHVYANYVKSVADTPGDPDANPDIVHVNGQVTFDSTFPGASARGSIRLPAEPRAYGLIVTGDTFEVVNSKLVDHEGREGVRLIASVDGIPLSWQAVVTLQDSAGRTIYNKSYIIHHDLWDSSGELLHINLPDLIPTPSRLEPPEGAAVRAAERAIEEIEALKGLVELSQKDAADSADAALTSRNQAQGFRNEAEGFRDGARTSASEAGEARDAALTSRNQAQGFRNEAEGFRNEAEGFRDRARTSASEAEGFRDDARTSRNEADASASAAATSQGAAKTSETNAKTSETNAAEHERRAGVERNFAEQVSTGVFARAVELEQDMGQFLEDWGAQFQSDYATLESLKGEMQNIATDVAIEVAKVDGVRDELNDALTVVRAHRWVPQGEWEDNLDYSAGDVVAHDGGSYYAQEDIPAGVEPPGGNWMVLGQGGVTDAAELTGALTEYVDSSRTVIDLGSYVPGVEPELKVTQLVAILGHLYLSLEASVEASRVTGALTDQVDASEATILVDFGNPGGPEAIPLSGVYAQVLYLVDAAHHAASLKADADHTHTIEDTDGLQAALNGKSATGHTHTVAQVDGLQAALNGKAATSHTHTRAQVGLGNVDNTSDANKPVSSAQQQALDGKEKKPWQGTQAQYDALGSHESDRTYYVIG